MGTEAVWIPLALSALGAGTSFVNTRNTARRQDQEAASNIRQLGERQRDADGEITRLLADTAASDPQQEIGDSLKQYTSELERNKGMQSSGTQTLSGASSAYQAEAAKDAMGVAKYGDKLAGLMSRIDGAARQRENEGIRMDQSQNIISQLARRSQGDEYLSNMRMDSIRDNPLLSAVSQLAYGAASTTGGSGTRKAGKYKKGLTNSKVKVPMGGKG